MERFYAIHNTPIYLGRQGESNAREVAFDISLWVEAYGDGAVQLMVRRSGEEAVYPVPLAREENTVVWTVSSADVAVVGQTGECELSYQPSNETLAKSETWATFVLPSMDGEVTEAPEAAQAWIDALRRATQANEQIAADASKSATQAAQSAGIAGTRASAAAGSAEAAAEHARHAEIAREGAALNLEQCVYFVGESRTYSEYSLSAAREAAASAAAVQNMSVEAEALETGEAATVTKEVTDGVVNLVFGLPKGETGATGETGPQGPQGEQGPQGDGVPAVSADDNGKFLRVVDGVWAAAALTDVSEEGA